MQTSPASDPASQPSAENWPQQPAYDSAYECSLEHWMHIALLLERAQEKEDDQKGYAFHDSLLSGFSFSRQEVTLLAVESATSEHFSSDIIQLPVAEERSAGGPFAPLPECKQGQCEVSMPEQNAA